MKLYEFLFENHNQETIKVNDLFIDELGDVYATGYFKGDSAFLQERAITGFHNNDMLFVAKIDARGEIA